MNQHDVEKRESALLLINQWRESGLSQGAFCRSEGIARTTFQHWRKRYDPSYEYKNGKQKVSSSTKENFIALDMEKKPAQEPLLSTDGLEIIYPNDQMFIGPIASTHPKIDVLGSLA